MTVQHIVLLEWIDGAAEDQKAAVLTQFRALAGAIPGIQSLKEGKNFSDRAQGVDHAAILVMDDKEALAGYGPHPVHQELVAKLGPLLKNITVIDFEA
jgi:hypothetical protein